MADELCKHEDLYFGSGGYYIFCRKGCGAIWDASGKNNGDECERPGNLDRCMTHVCQDTGHGRILADDYEELKTKVKALEKELETERKINEKLGEHVGAMSKYAHNILKALDK